MIPALSRVRQNSPAELQAFETTCERLGGFDPEISLEWVEGFLTALAAGPVLPDAGVWLPLMCGDTFERAFGDPPSADEARRALQLRLKVLCDQLDAEALMNDPQTMRLNPLMIEWTDADREQLVREEEVSAEEAAAMQTGAVWAQGFIDAVEAQDALWQAPAGDEAGEAVGELLVQVAALLIPLEHEEYKTHVATHFPRGEPTRDELLAEAFWAVQDLRVFWADHAPRPATRRVEATPGRNDPCPCGSGIKFKKCHGASSAPRR